MWAIVIVVAPRVAGQPIQSAIEMNRNRSERPVMISGITSGAVIMPVSSTARASWSSRCSASGDQRAESRRERGADGGDPQAQERRFEKLLVLQQALRTSAGKNRPRASRAASR